MLVPNEHPRYHNQGYKLAIVGEAPGSDESATGHPFVGYSGKLLWGLASSHGITRESCLVANVCQVQPPRNEIKLLKWDGPEIQAGLTELRADLDRFNPNLVLVLGNTALRAAKDTYLPDTVEDDPADQEDTEELELSDEENRSAKREAIMKWRGSLFLGFGQRKCLATVHPAAVLRQYALKPLLNFDLKRAKEEAKSPTLVLPTRSLRVDMTPQETLVELERVLVDKPLIAVDIEGGVSWMSCISIARSASECFIVSFEPSYWADLYDRMWELMIQLLTSPDIPKILQNALYDLFVLQHSYGIPVRGVVHDTMLEHWELYCELKKGLGAQASIYTREPYWKGDRTAPDRRTFHEYCCKDSAVTYEIHTVIQPRLTGTSLDHYHFNMSMLDPMLYMECKGINYDSALAHSRKAELDQTSYRLQWALNSIVGYQEKTAQQWFEWCRNAFTQRRALSFVTSPFELVEHARTAQLELAMRAAFLLAKPDLELEDHGELATLCGDSAIPLDQRGPNLNVKSTDQIKVLLYDTLKLPVQYKKEKGKKTDRPTTDVLALLTLYKLTEDPTLKLILSIRALRKRGEALSARTDPDGRIRCGYNVVGTKTGRVSCYKSPTGSGFNLQTVTKKDRDLFRPDDGYWLFECDLSGADGWTVAAWSAACGDRTLLDDLLYGLKPAKELVLMRRYGRQVLSWPRERLKEEEKAVKKDDWDYFAGKQGLYGGFYGMKAPTMSATILKTSYKLFGNPIYVSESDCKDLLHLVYQRYQGVTVWHERIKTQLHSKGYLVSANGHRRVFFGRRDDHDTFKEACADEPQNNTTFATKLALIKLWTDTENRVQEDARTVLRVQPLHTVHDSLIGQFKKCDVEWAKLRIKSYFANTMTIAGLPITVPYEGSYGESWLNTKEGTL